MSSAPCVSAILAALMQISMAVSAAPNKKAGQGPAKKHDHGLLNP
jgi:hypothetical protein